LGVHRAQPVDVEFEYSVVVVVVLLIDELFDSELDDDCVVMAEVEYGCVEFLDMVVVYVVALVIEVDDVDNASAVSEISAHPPYNVPSDK